MTQNLLVLLVLAIVIAITTRVIAAQLERVGDKLACLEELLSAEFNKEKDYYKAKESSESKYEEWMEMTRGMGPIDTTPEPPRPPAVVAVAEILRSINSHVAYLRRVAEAADKLASINRNG